MATLKRPSPTTSAHEHPNKRSRLFTPQQNGEGLSAPQSRVDPTYGQRGAFPGLDDDSGEGVFYGPAEDGLEYLRMVRIEARGVPNLLVAPPAAPTKPSEPSSVDNKDLYSAYGEPDRPPQGWYADGAYTATATAPPTKPTTNHGALDNSGQRDPQELYYTKLLARFARLRRLLAEPSATRTLQNTDENCELVTDPTPGAWRNAILRTAPASVLVASLSQETVMQGIEVLESVLELRALQRGTGVGAWAWALLMRCRDVGQMDSEAVGILRGLAKKASALLRRMRAGDGGARQEDSEEEEGEVLEGREPEPCRSSMGNQGAEPVDNDTQMAGKATDRPLEEKGDNNAEASPADKNAMDQNDLDLAAAREKLLTRLQGQSGISADGIDRETDVSLPVMAADARKDVTDKEENAEAVSLDENGAVDEEDIISDAHATLDMIVTIVGECYGQRDLLDTRIAWEEL